MTIKTVITPTDIGNGLAVSGVKVVANPGHGLAISGTQLVAQNLPVAQVTRTGKIGLTATLSAAASSSTEQGSALTYAWSASPSAGVTFGAPTGATTTVVTTSPGEYTITLTVTDAYGNTATATHKLKLDRHLQVNGANGDVCDRFSTLQSAINWINTNDTANASSYLIEVFGTTADAARIVPNLARVHFRNGAQLTVGVDFGAGTFDRSADNSLYPAIASGAANAITYISTTTLNLNNIGVDVAGASCISATGVTKLYANNCRFNSATGNAFLHNGTGTIQLDDCLFITGSSSGGNAFNLFNGATLLATNLYLEGGSDSYGLAIQNANAKIDGLYVKNSGGGVNARCPIDISMAASTSIIIRNFTAEALGTPPANTANPTVKVRGSGGTCILENGVMYAPNTGQGIWRVTPADPVIKNCSVTGTHASLYSASGTASYGASAWAAAKVYECALSGPLIGPVTFATATLSGSNYSF